MTANPHAAIARTIAHAPRAHGRPKGGIPEIGAQPFLPNSGKGHNRRPNYGRVRTQLMAAALARSASNWSHLVVLSFLYDFIWFLYDFILFYMIFGGVAEIFG